MVWAGGLLAVLPIIGIGW